MDTKYCLTCGREVLVREGIHITFGDSNGVIDILGDCSGPFAESCPPELSDDWELEAEEPTVEELAEMDRNAEQLLLELQ